MTAVPPPLSLLCLPAALPRSPGSMARTTSVAAASAHFMLPQTSVRGLLKKELHLLSHSHEDAAQGGSGGSAGSANRADGEGGSNSDGVCAALPLSVERHVRDMVISALRQGAAVARPDVLRFAGEVAAKEQLHHVRLTLEWVDAFLLKYSIGLNDGHACTIPAAAAASALSPMFVIPCAVSGAVLETAAAAAAASVSSAVACDPSGVVSVSAANNAAAFGVPWAALSSTSAAVAAPGVRDVSAAAAAISGAGISERSEHL